MKSLWGVSPRRPLRLRGAGERCRRHRLAPRALGLVLAGLAAALPTHARQDAPETQLYSIQNPTFTAGAIVRLPVRVIAGRLIVTCDVSTSERRLPANLFIDFESPSTLELHNQAAAGLKAESNSGQTRPITVHLPGLEFAVERRQIGDDPELDRFTRWYSIALGEVAVIGTLGGEVWRNFNVTFDLPAGEMVIEPLRAENDERSTTGLPKGTQVLEADLHGGLVWLRTEIAGVGGNEQGVMALGSGRYDSTIDWNVAAELGAPAGDVGSVFLGGNRALDLSERLALRPAEVPYAHADGPLGVLGLNVLEDYRVEVDRVNRKVFVSPIVAPDFPEADLAFFQATWDLWGPRDDADALNDWLTTWCPPAPDKTAKNKPEPEPMPRLAEEAARDLVEVLIYSNAPLDHVRAALAWLDRAVPHDLRTTSALEVMDLAASAGAPEALVAAGDLGVDAGRDDRYPDAVHKVHAKMGATLLDLGRGEDAWRHLLSSAFGDPQNGPVNLGLGEYYELQAESLIAKGETEAAAGRYRRAFSRYLQAAIRPDSGPSGVEAMARVQAALKALNADNTSFGADLVERLIAGRVRNFGAPGRFKREPEMDPDKVVLVEYFTNAYFGTEDNGGAIAGGLAQEGLQQHFDDKAVAFLSYHLPDPRLDPLVNDVALERADELNVKRPTLQIVDGVAPVPSMGKWRDAEALYTGTKNRIESALGARPQAELELQATLEGDIVRGKLNVENEVQIIGPALELPATARVHLVLAERRVIFPGSTGIVIHRMVARAGVLNVPLKGLNGSFEFEVHLADLAAANEATLERLVDEGAGAVRKLSLNIDPAEVVLVAWLQDPGGPVRQAIVKRPDLVEQP